MKKYILIVILLLCESIAHSQNVIDMVITEVMPDGDSTGIVDDFGQRNGWIEIFNKSRGTVSFGGCYLTNDLNVLKKSVIPSGDARTKLGARQFVLFYANGRGSAGTFYTDFKIERGETIYLISNDGKTIIDSLHIPASLPYGKSVSKEATDKKGIVFTVISDPTEPSPMVMGTKGNEESNSERIKRMDPHGYILSVVSISVVFAALFLLWILFQSLFMKREKKTVQKAVKKVKKDATQEIAAAIGLALDMENSREEYAAIATALHLYLNESVHDSESYVITIRKSVNSAWNNKSDNFRKPIN